MTTSPAARAATTTDRDARFDARTAKRLVLASALMLFLELALIRWLGSNIVHLSYFSNFVLLGSFLGIGLGFLLSRRDRSLAAWSPAVLAALVGGVLLFPVQLDQSGAQLVYFTSLRPMGPPIFVALPVVFLATAAALAGPAEIVGRCFGVMAPLQAYRLDLLGSLLGIAGFTLLSFVQAPPLAWGVMVAACFWTLLGPRPPVAAASTLLVLVMLLAVESFSGGTSWSPYYKVTTVERTLDGHPALLVSVNGVPHQLLRPAADKLASSPQYGLPYQRYLRRPLRNVLVVGAGTGSDVAIALRMGAEHVDAVEIDPRILQIGRERNPDHAYQSPRVTTHLNDGRAFLQQSRARYDLVLFALPDSLALVNGASAIRLESFLFTQEAVRSARRHLSSTGAFAMYNFYRERWLIDRLAQTVATAFGHEPCLDVVGSTGGEAVITAAQRVSDQSCSPSQPIVRSAVAPATDDRPFLYFRGSTLPMRYLVALGLVLLSSLGAVRLVAGPLRAMRPYADLFFMGFAFLLLETRNVATFALLFGTTWVVNAVVFAGILLAVLLAVEIARRWPPRSLPAVYAGIFASLGIAFAIPTSLFLDLSLVPRVFAAVAVSFLPVLVANLAFAARFASTQDSRSAFAVNVLGAMAGGCAEYGSLLIGYRNLLVITGVAYLLAFRLLPRPRPAS